MGTPDPIEALIAALDNTPARHGRSPFKLDVLFGDQPRVLEAVVRNHERGASPRDIAAELSAFLPEGESISDAAVESWLKKTKPKPN